VREIRQCRACGSGVLHEVLNLGTQALTGVFPKSRTDSVATGPLQVVKCDSDSGCGLVQLRHTFDLDQLYGMNYGYRSGLNASMVEHLRANVAKIRKLNVLEDGDLVIDIGSNDGTTLAAYPADKYSLVGIDPTGHKFSSFYPPHVKLIPEFFSADLVTKEGAGRTAKVITSFSMFYDLEDPTRFMREIEACLDDEGVWMFEQSYLPAMLRTNSFDTVCHEHLEFYCLKQICWMADQANLKVVDVSFNDINGGSFSVLACKKSSQRKPNVQRIDNVLADEMASGLDGLEIWEAFRERIRIAKDQTLSLLQEAKRAGKRVCGLGASTKGNVLLQYFGIDESLLGLIGEVNADKFGAFTPGTLIPIVPEDEVLRSRPDYLLILPWHFKNFFVRSQKLKGQTLAFPLPQLQIVRVPEAVN
jgi:NDP-4-keto-2,6-dideoxyhexose 3-C-methyltransferase